MPPIHERLWRVEDPVARKSSRSGDTGGDCVEVVGLSVAVGVRDSKDPDRPKLVFASAEWRAFARWAKSGGFDLR